jgi:DNA-binding transcriptional regulator YhcF (GntR family)
MIVLNLNRNEETPLFRQVFFQLKKLMDTGVLKPGFKMPPTRELAE